MTIIWPKYPVAKTRLSIIVSSHQQRLKAENPNRAVQRHPKERQAGGGSGRRGPQTPPELFVNNLSSLGNSHQHTPKRSKPGSAPRYGDFLAKPTIKIVKHYFSLVEAYNTPSPRVQYARGTQLYRNKIAQGGTPLRPF